MDGKLFLEYRRNKDGEKGLHSCDIVNNKCRTDFAKKMNGYGFRVQKSAFEAMVSESLYRKLLAEIPKLIDKTTDSVRIYKIRGAGEVNLFGINQEIKNEEVIII